MNTVPPLVWPQPRRSTPCPTKSTPSRSHSLSLGSALILISAPGSHTTPSPSPFHACFPTELSPQILTSNYPLTSLSPVKWFPVCHPQLTFLLPPSSLFISVPCRWSPGTLQAQPAGVIPQRDAVGGGRQVSVQIKAKQYCVILFSSERQTSLPHLHDLDLSILIPV